MRRTEVLQGVRRMRFEGLLDRHEEAAEMLGVSERTFRRWRDRLGDEGPAGLRDRRIGKPSSRRAAVEEIQRMPGLYQERYDGFTVKHFHEPLIGMMLHHDASRFAWLPGNDRQYDLVVTLDGATSAIYSAFLVEEEGTASSFRGLTKMIARHRLFCYLYTDRGSHYFHTPKGRRSCPLGWCRSGG